MKENIKLRAFSLIEAAIVLAVAAAVIGGIWIAASTVQRVNKINDTAKSIITIVSGAQKLIPFENYPSTLGASTSITTALYNAGVIPQSFSLVSGNAISAYNIRLSVAMSCYSATYPSIACPMLAVSLSAGYLKASECVELVKKFASLLRDQSNFLYTQITTTTNSGYRFLYPPITSSFDCSTDADFNSVIFWFRPS